MQALDARHNNEHQQERSTFFFFLNFSCKKCLSKGCYLSLCFAFTDPSLCNCYVQVCFYVFYISLSVERRKFSFPNIPSSYSTISKNEGQGVLQQMVWRPQSPDLIIMEVVLGSAETEARQPMSQNEPCPFRQNAWTDLLAYKAAVQCTNKN